MTKPDWCPQRVWDEAVKLAREYRQWVEAGNTDARLSDHAEAAMADSFARAIMAAEQREREACAQVVEAQTRASGMTTVKERWIENVGLRAATAIRNRGENQGD